MKIRQSITLVLLMCCTIFTSYAQSELKARIELEKAEMAFAQGNYQTALTHLNATEKLLGNYSPRIGHLKIVILDQLCDYYTDDGDPRLNELSASVTAYMKYNEKYPDDVVIDKFREVYAIEQKVVCALRNLEWGKMPEYEEGTKAYNAKDYATAMEWFRKGADKGNACAISNIGFLYNYGYGVEKDHVEAMKWNMQASSMGVPAADINIGGMYLRGVGVPVDVDKAIEYYQAAIEKGYMTANTLYYFGYCYHSKKDYPAAIPWYTKAADKGHATAMHNLGYFYDQGYGVKKDYVQARAWYIKAIDKGSANAMNNLGYLYMDGHGVAQDYTKAYELYTKAVDKGNITAMNNLGYLYDNGYGVKKDYVQAHKWYTKAAEKGNAFAMYRLGFFYDNGLGVKKDYAQAYEWYTKAADKGNQKAKERLPEIEKQLKKSHKKK